MTEEVRRGAALLNRLRLGLAAVSFGVALLVAVLHPGWPAGLCAAAAVALFGLGLRLRRPPFPEWLSHVAVFADALLVAALAWVGGGLGGPVPALLPVFVLAHALPLQRERVVAAAVVSGFLLLGLHALGLGDPGNFASQFGALSLTAALAWGLVWFVQTLLEESANREQDVDRLSRTLARYFSPQVAQLIAQHGEGALAAGRREITVMFADLAGFTTFSETAPSEEVVSTLSQYLDELCRVALRHGGTIDKFMGDEVMVVFGAPALQPDHAVRALAAAKDMIVVTDLLNQERQARGLHTLGLSVGVNTGEAVVGPIGSELRVQYTVIGDTINVAKRLQGQARAGEIVAGARTIELAGETVPLWEEIQVKGRSTVVRAARVIALQPQRPAPATTRDTPRTP